jgi:Tol biopolymer transport system component
LRFDWYGDNRRVIYLRSADDGSGTVEMRVADLKTGEEALLFTGPSAELAVAPDGGAVIYNHAASHFNMNLFMLPLEQSITTDRLPRPIGEPVRLTEGKGAWHVHGGGWSPDSRAIVYTRDHDRGDIYVIAQGASFRD